MEEESAWTKKVGDVQTERGRDAISHARTAVQLRAIRAGEPTCGSIITVDGRQEVNITLMLTMPQDSQTLSNFH